MSNYLTNPNRFMTSLATATLAGVALTGCGNSESLPGEVVCSGKQLKTPEGSIDTYSELVQKYVDLGPEVDNSDFTDIAAKLPSHFDELRVNNEVRLGLGSSNGNYKLSGEAELLPELCSVPNPEN